MTVEELAQRLELRVAVGGEALSREVAGGYCGDLLSWVMSRAQSGDVWFTVMGNVNSIAVAMLADVACIVLCEDAPLDEDARARAQEKGIAVLVSEENVPARLPVICSDLTKRQTRVCRVRICRKRGKRDSCKVRGVLHGVLFVL